MQLNYHGLKDRSAWEKAQIRLPQYDLEKMRKETFAHPTWVNFGSGNLFRAFHAVLQQSLLEQGLVSEGIITVAPHDYEVLDASYTPFDNLCILVTLMPDGNLEKTIVGSVAGSLLGDPVREKDYEQLKELFRAPSLQLVTFTITEKGYALTGIDGKFTADALKDFELGPHKGSLAMSKVAALLWERFLAGGTPLALVSTDNCSHNGEKLRTSVVTVSRQWAEKGYVTKEFIAWLEDEDKVSFPWTMIDKITPRPDGAVKESLEALGIEGIGGTVTSKGNYTAPFVNAEKPQYLVIEDRFPNGRPPLEKAGVYFTDRETVNKVEKMKVTTCLNPLHTALAVYGCLLGYHKISDEMDDHELKALVEKIGYTEGMPVVTDPGIIRPMDFIHEVIDERLPNPFLPDTPQRIACDTSQKVPIRYGETIKSYMARSDMDSSELKYIPLAIAGWLRYLLAVDDFGNEYECSTDPMLESLQKQLSSVRVGRPETVTDEVMRPILSNKTLFAVDLYEAGLAGKISDMLRELCAGEGAVRATLLSYLA